MISTQTVDSENKVPILGDIPVLGYAFKRRTKQNQKTELLIFLTPHVVQDPRDLAGLSSKEREKLDITTKTFKDEEMKKYVDGPAH